MDILYLHLWRITVRASLIPDSWLENHQLLRIQQSLFYIESSLDQPLSVDLLAKKVHWSRWQLQRVFQRVTGTSVALYVRHLRLSKAAKLLITSDKRHLDIALECGFDSEISFNKSFRNAYHCTPGNYRKRGEYFDLKQPFALSRPDKVTPKIEPKLLQIKIQTQAAARLYGMKGKINGIFSKNENFQKVVPRLWQKLDKMVSLDKFDQHIGVIDLTQANSDHTDMVYWATIQTDNVALQKQLDYIDIPQQHYAVLPHTGPIHDMVKTLQWFILEWLPSSGYVPLHSYELERYKRSFSSETDDAYMEYWIPVTAE